MLTVTDNTVMFYCTNRTAFESMSDRFDRHQWIIPFELFCEWREQKIRRKKKRLDEPNPQDTTKHKANDLIDLLKQRNWYDPDDEGPFDE